MAVRWDYWQNIPVVEVYDAVLLSAGIEPSGKSADNMGLYLDGYEVRGRLKRFVELVRDRIAWACANLEFNGGTIPVHKRYPYGAYPQVEADKHTQVRLSDFWRWAESMEWRLPNNAKFTTDSNPVRSIKPSTANHQRDDAQEYKIPISEILETAAFTEAKGKNNGIAGVARTILFELASILQPSDIQRLNLQTVKGNNPLLADRGITFKWFIGSHPNDNWMESTYRNRWQSAFNLINAAAAELEKKSAKRRAGTLASLM